MIQLRFAKFISYAFHPLLMPSYFLLFLFKSNTYLSMIVPSYYQMIICILVFFSTFLLPLINLLLLYKNGTISSLQMHSKEERKTPYFINLICCASTYYLLQQAKVPPLITVVFIGASVSLLMALLINLKWKISAHMIGVGGVTGALIAIAIKIQFDYTFPIVVLILLSGMIGTARMLLKAHNLQEIYSGYFLGLATQLITLLVL